MHYKLDKLNYRFENGANSKPHYIYAALKKRLFITPLVSLLITLQYEALCANGMIIIDCRDNRAHEFQENN